MSVNVLDRKNGTAKFPEPGVTWSMALMYVFNSKQGLGGLDIVALKYVIYS